MVAAGRLVAVLLGLTVLAGCASAKTAVGIPTAKLSPQNNSGESGTATLTRAGDKQTKVVVSVSGAPAGVSQPLHIHKGTCAQLDPKPAFPLAPLVNGKSETVINVSLDDLQRDAYAVNGHKSVQEASIYVFCGDIPKK